jgi:hypothetical protein
MPNNRLKFLIPHRPREQIGRFWTTIFPFGGLVSDSGGNVESRWCPARSIDSE